MPAVTLQEAAQEAYDSMRAVWAVNGLKQSVIDFTDDVQAAFPSAGGDNSVAERTVSNWIVVGRDVIANMINRPAVIEMPVEMFNAGVQYVYRICWAARLALQQGRITAPQGAAILAAYNAQW